MKISMTDTEDQELGFIHNKFTLELALEYLQYTGPITSHLSSDSDSESSAY